MPFRPGTKCFLFAWVPAWGASIFLASALIAVLELTPPARNCGFACTIPVADAITPQAKLTFGALLGGLMLLARHARARVAPFQSVRDALAGASAAALVLALVPEGFGIAFVDTRYLPIPNVLYLAGAALGGALGTLLERSCRRRLIEE